MPTIYDVAAQANVSASTVSHVINETRYVAEETRARVWEAIEALGYRPNTLARSLRRRETSTIGLLVPDNSNPFFAALARAIEDAGFAEGYNVILCNSDYSTKKETTYIDVLLAKQIDGLILSPSRDYPDSLKPVLEDNLPVVVVDRHAGDQSVDQVMVDNQQGGYLAGQYLINLGHRCIGCIAPPPETVASAGDRIKGFRQALAEAGLELFENCIVSSDLRYTGGEAAMSQLLARKLGLTAVFAANDLMAAGVINALRQAGLSVPHDVSVIGFDNSLQSIMMYPAITTVAQPIVELGRVAVSLLLKRIANPDEPPSQVVLPTTLLERESCRSISA